MFDIKKIPEGKILDGEGEALGSVARCWIVQLTCQEISLTRGFVCVNRAWLE